MSLMLIALAPAVATLQVELDGLRNDRGLLQACLTHDAAHFPDCKSDPRAIKQTVPARSHQLLFSAVPIGNYGLALFHDENANGKLDTTLGIPREGFGFSRNPVVRFGAPRFEKVNIQLPPGLSRIHVRLQYML